MKSLRQQHFKVHVVSLNKTTFIIASHISVLPIGTEVVDARGMVFRAQLLSHRYHRAVIVWAAHLILFLIRGLAFPC